MRGLKNEATFRNSLTYPEDLLPALLARRRQVFPVALLAVEVI